MAHHREKPSATKPSLKELLHENRGLFLNNIVPSEPLYTALKHLKLLPVSVIEDIQKCSTIAEKNRRLLQYLSVQERNCSLDNFCLALHSSGHNFLADLLQLEAEDHKTEQVRLEDLQTEFPKITSSARPKDIERLVIFINQKLKKCTLRNDWSYSTKEKERAIASKTNQIEDAWMYTAKLKERDEYIRQLEESLKMSTNEVSARGVEITKINKQVEDADRRRNQKLENQIRFNVANDNSLRRLNERLIKMEKQAQSMLDSMMLNLNAGMVRKISISDFPDECLTVTDRATEALSKILNKLQSLETAREDYSRLKDEHNYIINNIGSASEQDLPDVVKHCLQRSNDEKFKTFRSAGKNLNDAKAEKEPNLIIRVHHAKESEMRNTDNKRLNGMSVTERKEKLRAVIKQGRQKSSYCSSIRRPGRPSRIEKNNLYPFSPDEGKADLLGTELGNDKSYFPPISKSPISRKTSVNTLHLGTETLETTGMVASQPSFRDRRTSFARRRMSSVPSCTSDHSSGIYISSSQNLGSYQETLGKLQSMELARKHVSSVGQN